jgi:Spy/CpxP family protein refolding chaperone
MADLMKLDDATKAKFGEVLTANEKAGMEWGLMAAKKVQELTPALEEARAAKDEGLVKAIGAELSKLSADRNKIAVDGKARIMALLTDEQKVMWEGFELRRVVMQVLGGVNLSDEQRDKLQKLCEEKARQLGTVTMFPTVTDN